MREGVINQTPYTLVDFKKRDVCRDLIHYTLLAIEDVGGC